MFDDIKQIVESLKPLNIVFTCEMTNDTYFFAIRQAFKIKDEQNSHVRPILKTVTMNSTLAQDFVKKFKECIPFINFEITQFEFGQDADKLDKEFKLP